MSEVFLGFEPAAREAFFVVAVASGGEFFVVAVAREAFLVIARVGVFIYF